VTSHDGRTHYEILGVRRDASAEDIRSAYRVRARLAHPDRPGGAADAMARLNEAYRVLNDPGRRALYDRRLEPGASSPVDGMSRSRDRSSTSVPTSGTIPPQGVTARFPWRFVAGLAVVGSAGVIVSAALAGPEDPLLPDGVLRSGSCVEIDAVGFAREVTCLGDGSDRVVEVLVPTDSVCPVGTVGHLDRLGLGRACVEAG
jgi:molecular chaperone DnaJ